MIGCSLDYLWTSYQDDSFSHLVVVCVMMINESESENNISVKSHDHGISKLTWQDRWTDVDVDHDVSKNSDHQNNICDNHGTVIATDTLCDASTLASMFKIACDLLKYNGCFVLSHMPRCSSVSDDVMHDAKHAEELTYK